MRIAAGLLGALAAAAVVSGSTAEGPPTRTVGYLLPPAEASDRFLRNARANGFNTIALAVHGDVPALRRAAGAVRDAGLRLYYWIEVGRSPELAEAHPEWMASLQGHPEWRRHFPKAPRPGAGEVVKNYPWVPVLYREAFEAHLQRIRRLLADLPAPDGILLNDLQGPPSACGCGNLLCRWTADYGPVRTATRLPNDAAARFVGEVRKLAPGAEVVPVWTTECEEADQPAECAGVGCYPGTCWLQYTEQLMPLAKQSPTLGALLPYRAFQRDLPRYGAPAGWVGQALRSFTEMPPKRKGEPIPTSRVLAVLQGWDVADDQVRAQVRQAEAAGAAGYLISRFRIDQRWEPRLYRLRPGEGAGQDAKRELHPGQAHN